MTVLTLLVKGRSSAQLKMVGDLLRAEFENLEVESKVLGEPVNKWVQVSLSGEDEVIATNYLKKEIGTCPINLEKVENFSCLKGYITGLDLAKNELVVDVGIFEPKIAFAAIPLGALQTQLVDGKQVQLKKIAEIFGLQEDLPLTVKLVDSTINEDRRLKAELSKVQIDRFHVWRQSLLDRLIVLGAAEGEILSVLERTKLNRDVIDVVRLGLFEHALTCKLGTDAAGLIPRIGRYMRYAGFAVFSPRRVNGLIGELPLAL